jgi:hypothetical protein
MLLPLPQASAPESSLANHLAPAACRSEAGNKGLLNELARVVYLTYFMQQVGFGTANPKLNARAEAALERSIARAECEKVCRVDADDAPLLEEVLRLHDEQLSTAAVRFIVEAQERLRQFIRSGSPSPLRR